MRLWPERRWARVLLVLVAVIAVVGAAAWRYQSVLIGPRCRWYLSRVAEDENTSGRLHRRKEILGNLTASSSCRRPPTRSCPSSSTW